MSRKVTIRLATGRGGRQRGRAVGGPAAPGAPAAAAAPPPERIPRVARVLALAHHWRGLIQSGAVRDQADLARLVGVSRARVTQVMSLLWLAPDIQEEILLLDAARHQGGPLHRHLLPVTALAPWSAQRLEWTMMHTNR